MQEHFFDIKTGLGFIEYRLWNTRKLLKPNEKKYKKAKQKSTMEKNSFHNERASTLSSKEFAEQVISNLVDEILMDYLKYS